MTHKSTESSQEEGCCSAVGDADITNSLATAIARPTGCDDLVVEERAPFEAQFSDLKTKYEKEHGEV